MRHLVTDVDVDVDADAVVVVATPEEAEVDRLRRPKEAQRTMFKLKLIGMIQRKQEQACLSRNLM